jgi:formamidopyrimidine-DNA glycosylase
MLPHTHLVLTLDDGRTLRWRDVRRFGWLHLCRTDELGGLPSLAGCGPDALEVGEDEFVACVRGVRRGMKALLLAQDVVCGLGNIYADEVLFRGRIHPLANSGELGARRLRSLHRAVRETLVAAIAARGTSIDGAYVAVDGLAGGFQRRLAVYGREGQPCVRCGRPVRRILVSSRSTCYCPRCQRR